MLRNELFSNVLKDFDTGYWELHKDPERFVWSDKFYLTLGYPQKNLKQDLDYFFEHLIHPEDLEIFRDNFFNYLKNSVNFKQHIRLQHKNGEYKLFKCATNDILPLDIKAEVSILFFFEIFLEPKKTVLQDNFYYKETAEMTATGSWLVDFEKKQSFWDFQTRKILEYPDNYEPSLKDSASYYAEEHQQLAAECFFNCSLAGTPFSTEIKMLTANGRKFWAKAIGKPVYNQNKDIVGIRGVFQDIDEQKRKELQLQDSMDIIAAQNSRLFNFAHIVSHNLRSHTSNLSLLAELIEDTNDPKEKDELLGQIKNISSNLNTTIEHLNEVVTIHTNNNKERKEVYFENALKLVTNGISHTINNSNTVIHTDFSAVPSILYIPAYLESIFLNLITNAIKYKHPDRDPVIQIRSFIKEGQIFLEFSDNGIGVDMEKFGDKIFGMYKTFHYNEDAVGIGLFLTKNQIESLDGNIEIKSEVNVGTTFLIRF